MDTSAGTTTEISVTNAGVQTEAASLVPPTTLNQPVDATETPGQLDSQESQGTDMSGAVALVQLSIHKGVTH